MKKINKKTLLTTILSIAFLALLTISAFADGLGGLKPTPITGGQIQTKINKILGFIQLAGIAIALGMLIVIGIRYVTAEAGKKAEIKTDSINYVIGAFCIFAASGILQLIKVFSDELIKP